MKLLLSSFILLSGLCGYSIASPIHSIHKRDVSHLFPPRTSYGVPEVIPSAPYPPAIPPVQEYGPPHEEPIAEPIQEYGLPSEAPKEYLPPVAEPVSEYGPPAEEIPAPAEEYGPPAEAVADSVAAGPIGPYPPSVISEYGAPKH